MALEKKSPGLMHRWQARTFRLYSKAILYSETKVWKPKEKQHIELGDISEIRGDGKEVHIIVGKRDYQLRAPDVEHAKEWVEAVEKAAGLKGGGPASSSAKGSTPSIPEDKPLQDKKEKKDDDESESEEDDVVDEIPEGYQKPEGQLKTARASVSAEAYGQWNKKKDFTPPDIPKSDEQKARLKTVLGKSFMFQNLEANDMNGVISAMQEKVLEPKTRIINQGDDGDFLFVIESGVLDCYIKKDDKEVLVATREAGDAFGELALLYNCPRAASVESRDKCTLWQLDRETFNHIVKDAAQKKREKHEKFLKQVSVLNHMDAYSLSQVADALKQEEFKDGEVIVKEKEEGNKFYFLEEGKAVAFKGDSKVMDYKPGSYFGELALIKDQPRAATIKAKGACKVVSLERGSFKRLLGPLQDILDKEAAKYAEQQAAKNDEEESEEEDDACDEIPEHMKKPEGQMKGARASVSAEAYGQWNQKKAFTPPVIPKSDEQKARLKTVLGKSFMFQNLEENDMNGVISAMQEKVLEPKTRIINQGDDGDFLFVIESGLLDCYIKKEDKEVLVATREAGDAFGELALLYNCPRAASVESRDKCTLWQLDRETFNHIVKDAAQKKREKFDKFLKEVSVLSTMDAYARSQIADALKSEEYKDGEAIVKEKEEGNKFYFLEEGKAIATKEGAEVMEYDAGSYFGELALMKDQPRAATITAKGTCKVVSLDRGSFKRLLGPLEELLGTEASKYK